VERVVLASLADNPSSIIFGTDYATCDRQQHIAWVNALPVSAETKEDIFWRNAIRVFKLRVQAGNE
jgi:predicted TIM-barrel fold metal-dependent hydrolase